METGILLQCDLSSCTYYIRNTGLPTYPLQTLEESHPVLLSVSFTDVYSLEELDGYR